MKKIQWVAYIKEIKLDFLMHCLAHKVLTIKGKCDVMH